MHLSLMGYKLKASSTSKFQIQIDDDVYELRTKRTFHFYV